MPSGCSKTRSPWHWSRRPRARSRYRIFCGDGRQGVGVLLGLRRRRCLCAGLVGLSVVWLSLAACAPGPFKDPLAVMLDRNVDFRFRRHATRQAQLDLKHDERWFSALHQLAWEWGYPDWQRCFAIDHLANHDEEGFRRVLAKRIVSIASRKTLNHVLDMAVQRHWADFTPVAVASYARETPLMTDAQRPERRVIEHFNPGKSVQQAVFDVWVNRDRRATYTQQVAAWALLCRLVNRDALMALVAQAPPVNPLVVDLQAAMPVFVLPHNREGVLWLQFLRRANRRTLWHQTVSVLTKLATEKQQRFELRHLSVILNASDSVLAKNHQTLFDRVGAGRGNGRQRADTFSLATGSISARGGVALSERADLSWADLVGLDVMVQALADPKLVGQLFTQADADHDNKRTEYGGVIGVVNGRFIAQPYQPLRVRHDRVFYPPPQMIESLYTQLAHYHFHAQTYHNQAFASPGRGDREFARRMNFNCLVFTFVDRDHLQAHCYWGDRAVFDLGLVRRPSRTDFPQSRTPTGSSDPSEPVGFGPAEVGSAR